MTEDKLKERVLAKIKEEGKLGKFYRKTAFRDTFGKGKFHMPTWKALQELVDEEALFEVTPFKILITREAKKWLEESTK